MGGIGFLIVILSAAISAKWVAFVLAWLDVRRENRFLEKIAAASEDAPSRPRLPIFRSCLPPEEIEKLMRKIEDAEASLESEEVTGKRAATSGSSAGSWSTRGGLLGFPGSILLETRFEVPSSSVSPPGDDDSISRFLVIRATFRADAGAWGMLPLESYSEMQSWISMRSLELCRVDGEDVACTWDGGGRWGRLPPPVRLERDYVCEFWLPFRDGILHRWRVQHDVEYQFHLTLRYQHHSGTSEPFRIPESWSITGGEGLAT